MLVGDVGHNGHPFGPLQFPIIIKRWSCRVAMVCNGLDPWSNLVSIRLLWCCFQFFGNAFMTKETDLRNCEIKCLAFSIHVINWNFSVSYLLQCNLESLPEQAENLKFCSSQGPWWYRCHTLLNNQGSHTVHPLLQQHPGKVVLLFLQAVLLAQNFRFLLQKVRHGKLGVYCRFLVWTSADSYSETAVILL